MSEYVIILIWFVFFVLWAVLLSLPVIWHFQHRKKMRKYIQQVRKAFDGVLLNERERILLQAYLDAMECIGLRDEITAGEEISFFEKEMKKKPKTNGCVINYDAGREAGI